MYGLGYKGQLSLGVLTFVCGSITVIDYFWDGPRSITSLYSTGGYQALSSTSLCTCECAKVEDTGNVALSTAKKMSALCIPTDEVSHGSCHSSSLVSMSTLQEKVNFRQYQGMKYLDHLSLSRYYSCKPSVLLLSNYTSEKQCRNKTFTNQQSLVALVSFHGSGNTWVRHLLEQATGIFTGSIYCDRGLKVAFPGESVVSGNVIVIKTHRSDSAELPDDVKLNTRKSYYDKAIVIVRDPYDALVSEANRRWNSKHSVNNHLGVADDTTFISNSKWDWFVEYKGATWAFLLHTWLAKPKMPVLVVQYEALVKQTEKELLKILKFLQFPATSNEIKCAVENGKGTFQRLEHLNFNPYSAENYEAINRYISQAASILAEHGIKYDYK